MRATSRRGIGRMVAAVVVILVVVVAFGISFTLSSRVTTSTSSTESTSLSTTTTTTTSTTSSSTSQTSSSSTAVSSSSTSTGCTFTPPPPLAVANSTVPPIFTGCLTPGATGSYLLAITDPDGIITQGVIRTTLPAEISVVGAPVLNLTAAGNGAVAESVNDSTVLPMPDLVLLANHGYAVTIVNQSGENNTVTINLLLSDAIAFVGA